MKKRICLAVVLALALLVGGFSASASASCFKTVKVTRVSMYGEDDHIVYGQELFHVLPGYVWVWHIKAEDMELLTAAQTAYATGAPVIIRGDAETCPTEGAERDGGTVNAIWLTGK